MDEIKKLNRRIRRTGSEGLFHDTRKDVRLLAQVFNELHDKVNELVEEINRLKSERADKKETE